MTDDLKRFDKDGMRKAQRLRESPSPILSFLWLSSVRFRFFSLSKLSAQTFLTNLARTRTSSTPASHVSARPPLSLQFETPALFPLPLTIRKPADDKGANFLYYLEKLVGSVEVFNPYQKAYIQAFEGKSLTTQQWEEHFWCVPPGAMQLSLGFDENADWLCWLAWTGVQVLLESVPGEGADPPRKGRLECE